MITNIVASIVVSFVTNTVDKVTGYESHVPDSCPDKLSGCLVMHWKGVNPNQITTTTTAEKVTTITFDWIGKRTVEQREVLWSSNVVKNLAWIIQGQPGVVIENKGFYFPNVFTNTTDLRWNLK